MLRWLKINFRNGILSNDTNEFNELVDYVYNEDIYFKHCIDEMRQNQFGGGQTNFPVRILLFILFYTMMVSSIHLPSMHIP